MAVSREENRARVTRRIKELAWAQLAEVGATELSLRAIARDLGMVSSAVYRYYASRDELITALIIDAYQDLAAELRRAPLDLAARARALRRWALAERHAFTLVYGTAIPGYAAPAATIEPAAAVARAFADALRDGAPTEEAPAMSPDLRAGAERMGAELDLPPADAVRLAEALATLLGFLTMELGGHFVGTFEPADALFDELVARLLVQPAPG